ncbi:DNA helicase Pif1-like [Dillenia turbinata]|uniref:DNA helicase Pif1-like n=1 Tax=Dillenia turbinata TaxID=194707 RepID=A0AAN8ZUJ9_9MAGN
MNINDNEHLSTSVRTSVHGVITETSNDPRQTGIPRVSHLMTKIDNHLLTSSIGVPVNSTCVSEPSQNMNALVPSFIPSTEAVPHEPSSFVDSSNATSSAQSSLIYYSNDPYKMINRYILSPKNASVHEVNELIIQRFPGNLHTYIASDKTVDERHQGDYEDFLNSQNPRGLPSYKLSLKENCPIMFLKNINPTEGLCNDNEKNGIPFIRMQFPIRLCFSMTINKSQGQTLDYIGIYLHKPVFSHGQLYVALSRARSLDTVKVLIIPGTFNDVKFNCKTRNVVFTEGTQVEGIMFNADIPKMSPMLQLYKKYLISNAVVRPIPPKFQTGDLKTQWVEGIMFNADIPKMSPMLQLYKKYLISNAVVRPIPPKFQTGDLKTQWVISARTLVKESNDGDDNRKSNGQTRCSFNIDLEDDTDKMTAFMFGELAEKLLTFTGVQAMEHFNQNIELPLEPVHQTLREKMFVAHIGLVQSKATDVKQHFTVIYYCDASEYEINEDEFCLSESATITSHP